VQRHRFVASHASDNRAALCEPLRLRTFRHIPPHGAGVILSHVMMGIVKLLDVVFTRH
jgi:hypothetical protein